MESSLEVRDAVIWIKHLHSPTLRARLGQLDPGQPIDLEVDGTQGQWERMQTGRDGRKVDGLKPVGQMKDVWMRLYDTRRGEAVRIVLREPDPAFVPTPDHWTAALPGLMPEWASAADDEAFRDL